jgi:hypothetical protein
MRGILDSELVISDKTKQRKGEFTKKRAALVLRIAWLHCATVRNIGKELWASRPHNARPRGERFRYGGEVDFMTGVVF